MDFSRFKNSLDSIDHYVYALCEIQNENRIPFYIGKGIKDRCLQHPKETSDNDKTKTIQELLSQGRLGIDILRHGIKTDKTAKIVESTCIDLIGKGELTNRVSGSGTEMGRATIEEIHNLKSGETTEIESEHEGLAFLLNRTFKSGMTELELFEITRGVWRNVPRDNSIKFAFSTYGGLIKEVYQISAWIEAGTQQYFTREYKDVNIENRWEFIGKKASEEIRRKYIGKVIKMGRSYGNPFVRVGG